MSNLFMMTLVHLHQRNQILDDLIML